MDQCLSWLGKTIKVKIDRKIGSKHPDSKYEAPRSPAVSGTGYLLSQCIFTFICRFSSPRQDRGVFKRLWDKTIYPVNYGFIPGTYSEADNEEIDAYVLGPKEPLEEFEGKVIAVIQRKDSEIKLVVTDGKDYTIDEIKELTYFQEKYHQSEIQK